MKTLFNGIFTLTLLILFAGCSVVETSDDPVLDDSFFESAEALEMSLVSDGLVTIEQSQSGSYRFAEKSNEVINDSESFEALWNDLHANQSSLPELPEVDFSVYTVIASMMGIQNSGGHSIEIQNVAEADNIIGVKIEERQPGSGCFTTGALTSPFHIVKISKQSRKEFLFTTNRTIFECELE